MRAAVGLWVWVLCACGPIQSRTTLVNAAAELSAARASQAEAHAPFELVAAEVYLEKAREEQSYADFEAAVHFARKSLACAQAARKLALTRAKASFGMTASDRDEIPVCRPGPDRGPGAVAFDTEENAPAPPPGPSGLTGPTEPTGPTGPTGPTAPADPAGSRDSALPAAPRSNPTDPPRRPQRPRDGPWSERP